MIAARLAAAAAADLAIAIYNPARKPAPGRSAATRDLLLRAPRRRTPRSWSAATSAAPEEQITVTTLGELDPATVDMRCLLIVGSSHDPGRHARQRRPSCSRPAA